MSKTAQSADDRFHIAVGRVIREWATLEMTMSLVFSCLLQTDQFRARIVWSSMPTFQARRRLMQHFVDEYYDDPLKKRLTKLLERADAMSAHRNMLAHQTGGVHAETGMPFFMRDKAGNREKPGFDFLATTEFTFQNIEGWRAAIEALWKAFGNELNSVGRQAHDRPLMHRRPRTS